MDIKIPDQSEEETDCTVIVDTSVKAAVSATSERHSTPDVESETFPEQTDQHKIPKHNSDVNISGETFPEQTDQHKIPKHNSDVNISGDTTLSGENVCISISDLTEQTKNKSNEQDSRPKDPENQFKERDGFTSEIFKIEINNLPKKFGFAQLKQRLTHTLGLRPHKIKAVPYKTFAYVCFSCEEDRETALKAVNGHVWKGRELTAKKAQAAADPLKRKLESLQDETALDSKKKRTDENHFSDLPSALRLKSSVTPLWETPYSNQLEMKTETAKEVLKAVATHPDVRGSFVQARMLYNGLCSPLLPIVPSPVFQEYRNKSEFSIGRSEDGKETIVGFRFGLYKDGTDCVGSPSEILILPSSSKMVAQCFQEFLGSSTYPVFDHRTHEGHWRQLTVRTTRERGGVMGVAEFVVQNTSAEDREKVKEDIKNYFTEGPGKMSGVSTFYFRPCSIKSSSSTSEEPYELIYGDGFIYESLLEMKFRISPSAFFQVNTAAAEVMYKLIQEWTGASQTSTVLDICCGTGTIGLSLAKSVAKVIGIEMCKEAVEDAKSNASLNGVTNCEYYCAKVQDCIQDIVHNLDTSDVVAILDPPRAGIHQIVIKALRMCRQLKRIVYASCHPMIAKTNFIDLLRPASRKTKGVPFKFIKAQPIDMFPYTKHMELLMLLERDSSEVPSS